MALVLAAFSVPWTRARAVRSRDARRRRRPASPRETPAELHKFAPPFTQPPRHPAAHRRRPLQGLERADGGRRLARPARPRQAARRARARALLRLALLAAVHQTRRPRHEPDDRPHDPLPRARGRGRHVGRTRASCASRAFDTTLVHEGFFEEDGADLGARRHAAGAVAPAGDPDADWTARPSRRGPATRCASAVERLKCTSGARAIAITRDG